MRRKLFYLYIFSILLVLMLRLIPKLRFCFCFCFWFGFFGLFFFYLFVCLIFLRVGCLLANISLLFHNLFVCFGFLCKCFVFVSFLLRHRKRTIINHRPLPATVKRTLLLLPHITWFIYSFIYLFLFHAKTSANGSMKSC